MVWRSISKCIKNIFFIVFYPPILEIKGAREIIEIWFSLLEISKKKYPEKLTPIDIFSSSLNKS